MWKRPIKSSPPRGEGKGNAKLKEQTKTDHAFLKREKGEFYGGKEDSTTVFYTQEEDSARCSTSEGDHNRKPTSFLG